MNKLKSYAIKGGCLVAVGAAIGVGLRVSGSDAGKTPGELHEQRATLSRIIVEETEGRLLDATNPFDPGRFVTKRIKTDLNTSTQRPDELKPMARSK